MRSLVVIMWLVTAAILMEGGVSGQELEDHLVFAADFEGTAVAVGAGNRAVEPLTAEGVEYTSGLQGQALRADGALLTYPGQVIPMERGTLVMWVSPLPDPMGEEFSRWRVYFGDAEQWGPEGMPRLWLWEHILRLDFDIGKWLWSGVPAATGWGDGGWHQLVAAWDCAGELALYCDGRLLMRRKRAAWNPRSRDAFRVGSGVGFDNHGHLPAHALIDEVRLYDEMWSPEQVLAHYHAVDGAFLEILPVHALVDPGVTDVVVQVSNVSGRRWQGAIQWTSEEGQGQITADLAPDQTTRAVLTGAVGQGSCGPVAVTAEWDEGPGNRLHRERSFSPFVLPPQGPPPEDPPVWRPVRVVDCAEEAPVSAVGETQAATSAAGRYREAGRHRWDRFGYVFRLSGPARMVRLTVDYPDDARRAIVIGSNIPIELDSIPFGTERQVLSNGILTGGQYPLTHRLQQRTYVFPALSEHVAVIVETGVEDEPAAVTRLTVEESELRYGPAAPPPVVQARDHRRMGLYWEDPYFGPDFGWTGIDYTCWDEVLCRALDYLDWSGQDLIVYPTVWYRGPLYRSRFEPGAWLAARKHPAEYPRLMAKRCGERGVLFVPTFTIWTLPSLGELLLSEEQVIAGEPSVNTVTREGKVLTDCNWHSPPVLNAHHPAVQQAVLALVDEQVELCGEEPSFGGVEFALWPSSAMQAGARLITSYDDWTLRVFARDTGETLPGEPGAPERFKQRAEWILGDAGRRAAWVTWRCGQMTAFYEEVAHRVARAGAEANLRLAVQQPYPWYEGDPDQALREQGIDLKALAGNPRIVVVRFTNQTFHRIARLADPAFTPPGGTKLGVITGYDAREMTRASQAPFYGMPRMGAIVHQQYYESHTAFRDRARARLHFPAPWRFEAHGRCSQPAPGSRMFLRHPALAVYLFDAHWIGVGGFNLGTAGAENEVREFATALRALPRASFEDLGCTGSVVARRAEAEGKQWVYAVNITPDPSLLGLRVKGGRLQDAVSGQAEPEDCEVELPPYALRAWCTGPECEVEITGPQRPPVKTGLGDW